MALGELGATVEPMDDDLEPVEPIWFAYASALWNARFRDALPQWRNKLSPTLIRQMELGKDTTGEAVGRALLARTQLFRKVQGWFDRFDVIVTPTLARTAIPIEERLFEPIEIEGQKTDTVRKAWYPYTHPFNLTGHPAMTPAVRLPQRRPAGGDPARRPPQRGRAPVQGGGAVRAGAAVGGQAAEDRRAGLVGRRADLPRPRSAWATRATRLFRHPGLDPLVPCRALAAPG